MFDLAEVHGTRRLIRNRIQQFHQYLRREGARLGSVVCPVRWEDHKLSDLAIGKEVRERELLLPWEVMAVRQLLLRSAERRQGQALEMAVLLGVGAGLRIGEAAYLTLDQVHVPPGVLAGMPTKDVLAQGLEVLLEVAGSKTEAGRRFVPLHLLLPAEDLDQVLRYVRDRCQAAQGDGTARLLGEGTSAYAGEEISAVVGNAIKAVTGKPLAYHALRHAFASWFPLRWFVARYGRAQARSLRRLLTTPWFAPEALARFARLFPPVPGGAPQVVSHPLQTLAILIGHAGPESTVNTYIHTMDWLQRLFMERAAHRAPEVWTLAEATAALACTRASARDRLRQSAGHRAVAEDQIPSAALLREQCRDLDQASRRR